MPSVIRFVHSALAFDGQGRADVFSHLEEYAAFVPYLRLLALVFLLWLATRIEFCCQLAIWTLHCISRAQFGVLVLEIVGDLFSLLLDLGKGAAIKA